jgi:hypothetical protein
MATKKTASKKAAPVKKVAAKKVAKASAPVKQTITVITASDRNEARRELARLFKSEGLNVQERNAKRRELAASFKNRE